VILTVSEHQVAFFGSVPLTLMAFCAGKGIKKKVSVMQQKKHLIFDFVLYCPGFIVVCIESLKTLEQLCLCLQVNYNMDGDHLNIDKQPGYGVRIYLSMV
jgi:hypothetical protein